MADPRSFSVALMQAREGSGEALGALVEEVRPGLRAFLARNVGDRMRRHVSVSDLEQDILIRIPEMARALPDDARQSDLMALVLRHAHWAIGKASRRQGPWLGESAVPREPAVTAKGEVTAADEFEHLWGLVEELPEELAEVVRLRALDRTFEQIGQELDIGPDAARKRFLRAARLLRDRSDR